VKRVAGPLLVVVTGMPGAGKTTVARALAHDLALPLVSKDDVKERLYDALGAGDVAWSQRLGSAAYSVIFGFCSEVLVAGRSVIAEANFFKGSHEANFRALPPHRLVQIHCQAPLELLVERFSRRLDRHVGHLDRERVAELAGRFESGVHSPLALDGDVIQLDTAQEVDVRKFTDQLRRHLPDDDMATIPAP
jgi:predicted kinase